MKKRTRRERGWRGSREKERIRKRGWRCERNWIGSLKKVGIKEEKGLKRKLGENTSREKQEIGKGNDKDGKEALANQERKKK